MRELIVGIKINDCCYRNFLRPNLILSSKNIRMPFFVCGHNKRCSFVCKHLVGVFSTYGAPLLFFYSPPRDARHHFIVRTKLAPEGFFPKKHYRKICPFAIMRNIIKISIMI